jgi:NADH:ubiquinone reductase (non-electrogenic)
MYTFSYVGSDKAVADLPFGAGNLATGGVGKFKIIEVLIEKLIYSYLKSNPATFAFWRSAYISNLFSTRNRSLVITDWLKKTFLGRDISRE